MLRTLVLAASVVHSAVAATASTLPSTDVTAPTDVPATDGTAATLPSTVDTSPAPDVSEFKLQEKDIQYFFGKDS